MKWKERLGKEPCTSKYIFHHTFCLVCLPCAIQYSVEVVWQFCKRVRNLFLNLYPSAFVLVQKVFCSLFFFCCHLTVVEVFCCFCWCDRCTYLWNTTYKHITHSDKMGIYVRCICKVNCDMHLRQHSSLILDYFFFLVVYLIKEGKWRMTEQKITLYFLLNNVLLALVQLCKAFWNV